MDEELTIYVCKAGENKMGALTCPFCKKKEDEYEFRDELSAREYQISGLCQKCQDETFVSVRNTRDVQTGKLTPIVPATFVTTPGSEWFLYYKYYFFFYKRECSLNHRQLKAIRDETIIHRSIDKFIVRMHEVQNAQ